MLAIIAAVFLMWPYFPLRSIIAPALTAYIIGVFSPATFQNAAIIFALWFLVLGMKESAFLDRNRVHELFIILSVFLGGFILFADIKTGKEAFSFARALGGSTVLYFLTEPLFRREAERSGLKTVHPRFAAAVYSFIVGEMALVIALVPMNIYYKTALLLLSSATLLDAIIEYWKSVRSKRQLFLSFSVFFIGLVFILVS
ncbi:MAG: hypothetical protein V1489_00100, partial [Candidatus Liptonbacteria bacterium]